MAGEIQITKSEAVTASLDKRHILDEDIKKVIASAEASGEKLFQPDNNRYLAKMILNNVTFYVEYSIGDGSYIVHTAYAHRERIVRVLGDV